jgi:hypothetical protein
MKMLCSRCHGLGVVDPTTDPEIANTHPNKYRWRKCPLCKGKKYEIVPDGTVSKDTPPRHLRRRKRR